MNESSLLQTVQKFTTLTYNLSDADLEREWGWGEYNEGVRFSFFRVYEELRQLAARLGTERADSDQPLTTAQRTLAQYHIAYRDLQAILLGVSDAQAVLPPAEDEWPIREVVIHMIGAERAFFAVNLDALQRVRLEDGRPMEMSDEAWEVFWEGDPFNKLKEQAPLSELLSYYENLHERVLIDLADITKGELDTPVVFWENTAKPLEFRLHRFDAHLRQHTIQAEKTLEATHIPFTEARRLLRLIFAAFAEVETTTTGVFDFGAEECERVAAQLEGYTEEIAVVLKA